VLSPSEWNRTDKGWKTLRLALASMKVSAPAQPEIEPDWPAFTVNTTPVWPGAVLGPDIAGYPVLFQRLGRTWSPFEAKNEHAQRMRMADQAAEALWLVHRRRARRPGTRMKLKTSTKHRSYALRILTHQQIALGLVDGRIPGESVLVRLLMGRNETRAGSGRLAYLRSSWGR
jgi:hypothetical protein